jgi:hypothetical protein
MTFTKFLEMIKGFYGENKIYVRKNRKGDTLIYVSLKTQNPTENGYVREDFCLKISGQITFTDVVFENNEDDGYLDYELYTINPLGQNRYQVYFDVGEAILTADKVDVVSYDDDDFSIIRHKLSQHRKILLFDDETELNKPKEHKKAKPIEI